MQMWRRDLWGSSHQPGVEKKTPSVVAGPWLRSGRAGLAAAAPPRRLLSLRSRPIIWAHCGQVNR